MTTTPVQTPTPAPLRNAPRAVPTSFLGRLSVPQKIGLITLALGVPLAYSVYNNISNNNRELAVIQEQQRGFDYLQSIEKVLSSTQESRISVTNALAQGARGENLVTPEVQKVTAALAELQQLNAAEPLSEQTSAAITTAQNTWQEFVDLLQSPQAPNSTQVAQTYNFLFDNQLLPLTQEVVNSSQLNASSDTSVNALLNVASNLFPGQWNTSGYIRSLTARGFNDANPNTGAIDPANQREYQVRLANARAAHNIIVTGMERAIDNTPAQAEALTPALEEMQANMGALFQNFETAFLTGPEVNLDRKTALDALTPSFASEARAYQASLQALGTELDRVEQSARNQQLINTLLLLASLAVAGLLAYLAVRTIINSIATLTGTANRLRQGDFSVRTPITTADEFATLGNSLNAAAAQLEENERRVAVERLEQQRLQNNIGQFLDVTMDIADGDLTKRGVVTEDILGNVVDSINLMTEELAYVLGGVQQASASVTSGSQAMLATTSQIQEGSEQTTRAAQTVAEQTAEVSQQIQEMARIAQASAEAARQALLASQQGQEAVEATLSGMQEIRETTLATQERISSLADRSKQIGQIVDTISNIASQTNLLSLHASIEAAGAGEAGERFSVVADEVRQLADESAQATRQIASLISGIQSEITEVVRTIQANTEQVNQGYQVAGTAGQRLGQIGDLSRESARLAEQISISTREQVQNIEQMSSSVQDIAQTAERSQQSVEQGRAAAQQLQQLADQLNASLSRFRLPS